MASTENKPATPPATESPTNDIAELRSHLFDALRGLKNKDDPLDLDRARAIADVSRTIIASAKVEVDFARVTGNDPASGFLGTAEAPKPTALPNGIVGQKVHRLK